MSLFRIKKELQFGVCNHGKPYASLITAKEGQLIEGEKEVGRAVVNKEYMTLHWLSCDSLSQAELSPGKKRKSFFFLLGSAAVRGPKRPHSGLLTLY